MYENRNKRKKKVLTKSKFTFAAIKENEEILQQTFLTKKKKYKNQKENFYNTSIKESKLIVSSFAFESFFY